MDPAVSDQQPIARTVGRRVPPPVGMPPTPEARAAWDSLLAYRARAPKGVFVYRSHAEMARDRWTAEAVSDRTPQRAVKRFARYFNEAIRRAIELLKRK